MKKKKDFDDPCDVCGRKIVWKIERRTETTDEWIGVCSNCGVIYTAG